MAKNKLLIISGPTATGKTALAVKLAKKFNGELISADSRQIYQGLDIGVGKDHPQGTPIHLIDIITPDKIFSVAEFKNLALKKINEIQNRHCLPIIVGCSGFYIDSIINQNYSTFSIKPKKIFRFILKHFPVKLLQLTLKLIDPATYKLLNNSDINNPRRLIRKIEIKLSLKSPLLKGDLEGLNILHLSLTAPSKYIYEKIDARVEERLKIGHFQELKNLLKKYSWNSPGLKVSAYQVMKSYFENHESIYKCQKKWQFAEHRDARHQKTWFKKYTTALFFDISLPRYSQKASLVVLKWYNNL